MAFQMANQQHGKTHQEPAPGTQATGNVIETSAGESVGHQSNGAAHPMQMTPDAIDRLVKMADSPLFKVNGDILGDILWKNGYQQEAQALRASDKKQSFFEKVGATFNRNVTFKHLAVGFVVGSLVYVVWEGLAMAFDLPSFEILFKHKPMVGGPTAPPGVAAKR